jgi:hypothetical protein
MHQLSVRSTTKSQGGGTARLPICESTQEGGGFADLMRDMPNAIFVELHCGEELAPRTLLEIMLAVEKGESRLPARPSDGSKVFDLPVGFGFGPKGDRLAVFQKADWTEDHSRLKVLLQP